MRFERKININVQDQYIDINLVYRDTKIIRYQIFRFERNKSLTCISYDQKTRKWMDTTITWTGPRKGDLKEPWNIKIKCIDSAGYSWDSPLSEFLNPGLFTIKEYVSLS